MPLQRMELKKCFLACPKCLIDIFGCRHTISGQDVEPSAMAAYLIRRPTAAAGEAAGTHGRLSHRNLEVTHLPAGLLLHREDEKQSESCHHEL